MPFRIRKSCALNFASSPLTLNPTHALLQVPIEAESAFQITFSVDQTTRSHFSVASF
jgi:hypothetical protein